MPPHCDAMDGPVVRAAIEALEQGRVELILPCVPASGEDEVRDAFALTMKARAHGDDAREAADRYFFETVVRIHRAGEGAPFTGLKPAGLDHGPVLPLAEAAERTGDAASLTDELVGVLKDEIEHRLAHVIRTQTPDGDVPKAREHVEAALGFQVWAHHLYQAMRAPAHGHAA